MDHGLIKSCHDLSDGGLIASAAEMAFGGDLGIALDLSPIGSLRTDYKLFSESNGRWLIEVEPKDRELLEKSIPGARKIGRVLKEKQVKIRDREVGVSMDLCELREIWEKRRRKGKIKMKKACVLIIEGTNCELETKNALTSAGIEAEIVHLKQMTDDVPKERRRRLSDYEILMLPGGWSAGDYVRAGAIYAARIKSRLMPEIKEFVDNGYLVGGICNGFQVLTELGLLPAFDGIPDQPSAALTNNANTPLPVQAGISEA